mgnify:CR=1 FL=1
MIVLKEVSCTFSDGFGGKGLFTAVSPLSAHFSDGSRYAIVGESGSGKTTLARMIAGLQRPSGGSVFVDGTPVYERKRAGKEHFRKVQIIQQNSASALDPKISVGKSIEEPLLCFFHMEREKRRERCRHLMKLCNLPLDYYIFQTTVGIGQISDGVNFPCFCDCTRIDRSDCENVTKQYL